MNSRNGSTQVGFIPVEFSDSEGVIQMVEEFFCTVYIMLFYFSKKSYLHLQGVGARILFVVYIILWSKF